MRLAPSRGILSLQDWRSYETGLSIVTIFRLTEDKQNTNKKQKTELMMTQKAETEYRQKTFFSLKN